MAVVEPLRAMRYDPRTTGTLERLVAPPYDVIDEPTREDLAARSPFNVVHVDLPRAAPGEDPYALAGELWEAWGLQGAIVRDREPAIWAYEQDYAGPDGRARTRRGLLCRVRVEDYGPGRIRPHERTHPGPREDRLRLTRATRANLSPIFTLFSDPAGAAWGALEPTVRSAAPWAEIRDGEGTVHRTWPVQDPDAIAAVQTATADAELLIADGHHRYETARVYAEEIGGEGAHRFVLMCLVALQDPGLTVFPTHRLIEGTDGSRREALEAAIRRDFVAEPVAEEHLLPEPSAGPLQMGYLDAWGGTPLRLTLRDQAIADRALEGHSAAYRQLDTAVLESLLLRGALGLGEEDIAHLRGLGYARHAEQAIASVRSGRYDAAFLLRPTPVEQIQAVAGAGESMPPKSTFFFPKLLTGLLFHSLG